MKNRIIELTKIRDGFKLLVQNNNGRPADTRILSWPAFLRYRWWQFRRAPMQADRTRATWAQLFRAFRISDTKELVRDELDADSIPSAIDVPIQRVRLFDLGCIALALGFTKVKIIADERDFTAVGPYGTILTQEIPTFGKVIRFEGDVDAIKTETSVGNFDWVIGAIAWTNGRNCFGDLFTSSVNLNLEILAQALHGRWSEQEFAEKQRQLDRLGILSRDKQLQAHLINEPTLMRGIQQLHNPENSSPMVRLGGTRRT